MTAQILDGKAAANHIRQTIQTTIQQRQARGLRAPSLAVILIGEDPASQVYVNAKRRACAEAGIRSLAYDLPASTSQAELLQRVANLSADPSIDGILVQLPLPPHIDAETVLDQIPAHKDVDGFHPYNLGRLAQRRPSLRSCTPYGVIKLLAYAGLDLAGLHAVVVGASNHVGRPMALELLLAKCTVTVCHRFSQDLAQHVQQADLLVVATGKRGLVQSEWIKPGAIVVDIGIHRLEDGSLKGDLEFASAKQRAAWITPVPGGVGPMTIAMLLQNTLEAAIQDNQATTEPS
jgi:methylenetetrahydrofolate dehydrogenase (NADP+)/methenyltetrahydrofolate cyclohydrolase